MAVARFFETVDLGVDPFIVDATVFLPVLVV